MKKNNVFLVAIVLSMSAVLFGCSHKVEDNLTDAVVYVISNSESNPEVYCMMEDIPLSGLSYDTYTKNVYIKNNLGGYATGSIYTEYLSGNMKHCKYIDGKIVEVDENGNVIE